MKTYVIRTTSTNEDFQALVTQLDLDLALRNGDEQVFYSQFNKLDAIRHVLVAYRDGIAVGCGAIKKLSDGTMEIKRMFVRPEYRGMGVAAGILLELERWAGDLGYVECVLETGKKQIEAVRLYQRMGYKLIPNYGQYAGVENSVCMKKLLPAQALAH